MKAKSKTTWKNLRAEEDKPITLHTTLSLPEDDSGAWRHYRLRPRVICAHISSKCATDSAGSSAAVGVCGWPRPSMCAATYLPSLCACSCRFSSSCFRGTSRRMLVPVMKANVAAISAAATMRWPCHKYHAAPRGSGFGDRSSRERNQLWKARADLPIRLGAGNETKLIVLGSAGRSVPRRRPHRALPRDWQRPLMSPFGGF